MPPLLYIDLEPDVVNQVRADKYRSLFYPETKITGKEDAAFYGSLLMSLSSDA